MTCPFVLCDKQQGLLELFLLFCLYIGDNY
jgi:hypothetical protein